MPNLFPWPSQSVSGTYRRRKMRAQYGDGYSQVAMDGINNKVSSWPFRFTGPKAEVDQIIAFLDANPMSFTWEDPQGVVATFEYDEYQVDRTDINISTITATFNQVFR